MSRLRYGNVVGSIGSGGLTNSATSHTFTAPLTYGNGTTLPTLTGSNYFLLTIFTSGGFEVVKVTAYDQTTGAATIVRAQEGTAGVAHSSGDVVTMAWYPSDGGGVGTGVLAYKTVGTTTVYTTTSTSAVDVDASNAVISHVAPPSGKVMVQMAGYGYHNAAGTIWAWLLRDGSSTVTGSQMNMSSQTEQNGFAYMVCIEGLTPGATYTWKWGWLRVQGSGTVSLISDPANKQMTMVVTALP